MQEGESFIGVHDLTAGWGCSSVAEWASLLLPVAYLAPALTCASQ